MPSSATPNRFFRPASSPGRPIGCDDNGGQKGGHDECRHNRVTGRKPGQKHGQSVFSGAQREIRNRFWGGGYRDPCRGLPSWAPGRFPLPPVPPAIAFPARDGRSHRRQSELRPELEQTYAGHSRTGRTPGSCRRKIRLQTAQPKRQSPTNSKTDEARKAGPATGMGEQSEGGDRSIDVQASRKADRHDQTHEIGASEAVAAKLHTCKHIRTRPPSIELQKKKAAFGDPSRNRFPAYRVDSISKPQASSNGSGMYLEFLFRRAHSRSRVERRYWSGESLYSCTTCSNSVIVGVTGPMGSGLPQLGFRVALP